MALYFSRNTKVYLKQGSNMWEIPVLDGFSFSQGSNSSEITLSEGMKYHATERKVRRSRRMFTDSLAPAEWSFSTYARPFQAKVGQSQGWEANAGDKLALHHAVEEPLWANFVSTNSWTPSTLGADTAQGGSGGDADANSSWAKTVTNSATNMIIDFEDSETGEVGEFELVFIISNQQDGTGSSKGYEIKKCVVNEVTLDFDVEGLATFNWSGFGSDIDDYDTAIPSTVINEEINTTDNFIRNRLTTLNVQAPNGGLFAGGSEGEGESATTGHYNVVLTGGSISFSNNITYLTPETLGKIDTPIGHVTGTRTIGGSFTAYLDSEANSGTAELFDELVNNDKVITNSFNLTFAVGGSTNPKIEVAMPQCHLEIPTHSIEDVISMEVNFHSLSSSFTPTSADNFEAKLTYTGIANA